MITHADTAIRLSNHLTQRKERGKMKIIPINPPKPEFYFTCVHCNKKSSSLTGYADLDGKPFQDYYCETCANEIGKG